MTICQVSKTIRVMAGFLCLVFAGFAYAGNLPEKGQNLPDFVLQSPSAQHHQTYLGITTPTFKLADIKSRLLVIEVIGVYCPQCYRQAPGFNNLYHRIEKSNLKGEVKLLGIAAGGNAREIQYLHDQKQYSFPIAPDLSFEIHKLLGEPRTPFTLIATPAGKALFTHMGVIENIDTFWKTIGDLMK